MTMDELWKSWHDVRALASGKTVVCYGRSEYWIPKTLPQLRQPPSYIVDSAPAYRGTRFDGLDVCGPDRLAAEDRDGVFVIITSAAYHSIAPMLDDMWLQAGRHYCCCPEYRDHARLESIRNYEAEIIVTSPDYADAANARYSRAGGGIFRYNIGGGRAEIERLVPGQFRQLAANGEAIYGVEFNEAQVYVFDRDFKTLDKFPLDRPHYCGIEYDDKRKLLVLVNSATDSVSFHDPKTFKRLDTVRFSAKSDDDGSGRHHLNDACIVGDEMFVSCFSLSGNWKRNIYDGGIAQYDLEHLSAPPVPIVRDLWMPHSPKIINDNLCYLESAPGRLYLTSTAPAGQFSGFARGLAYDGRYYFVGQSETMYLGRVADHSNNVMMNAGVYLFDPETKASRFFPMLDTMNVHDLMILN